MIKIVNAQYLNDYVVKLEFSDNSFSNFDFSYLLEKNTELTNPLKDLDYFKSFFLELGAICWKNGLELSPESLYQKAKITNKLYPNQIVA